VVSLVAVACSAQQGDNSSPAGTTAYAGDPVAQARILASDKQHREEALALLKQYLAATPDDNEARVLYGVILSWQGKYDEARNQLSQVLANKPGHGDALPALINVELWSDHPKAADQLIREALVQRPNDIPLMLLEARALRNMNRPRDAVKVLDQVLQLDPHNRKAKEMEVAISVDKDWEFSAYHTYDWYSDGRGPQHESTMQIKAPTQIGSVILRENRADHFQLTSYQTELDFYPHFRPGTYAYFNVGYSADENLYPSYRVGADLYQSIGHGIELSGGYRRMQFGDDVNIATGAIAKYYRSFLFTGRGFFTPSDQGTSKTGVFSARYFLSGQGTHDYIEVRYSYGASPAQATTLSQILTLDSWRFSGTIDKTLARHFTAAFEGGVAGEKTLFGSTLDRWTLGGGVYYRF
jgi:YaiO family outer membrane protein